MKTRTIKRRLGKVIGDWVKSITDEQLARQVKENVFVTGGSIVSMLLNEPVNDYDVYCRSESIKNRLARYYEGIVDHKKAVEDKEEYEPVHISDNAITLKGKIQIITRFYGSPREVHRQFDFVHCTCYWKSWDKELVLPQKALTSILTRELRYVGSIYPICSMVRMRNYISKGWSIHAAQILKMLLQVRDIELENEQTLSEQLGGVDVAYFGSILDSFTENENDQNMTAIEYLSGKLDEIF